MVDDVGDLEDIRLAVVLNGGVSLAIWIGGVAREINRLSTATDSFYQSLLNVTQSTVRVDVLAGTSAGGINAPALALAEIFGQDLSSLGDLWITAGGFADLLHDPMDKDPLSLLKGDQYLLVKLLDAFRRLKPDPHTPERDRPVDLTVTGALWKGERVPFMDDYGSQIVESVHELHFRFHRDDPDPAWDPTALGAPMGADDFATSTVVDQLALAARSTSANPFGFEASWVPMQAAGEGHPAMKGVAQMVGGMALDCDRFVLDGGILINKPVRPALDAINAFPAERQVRRVMAYVQPDPGDPTTVNIADDRGKPPSFIGVFVASGLTLPKAQTIAGDLADIRDHNAKARLARATRADQLGTLSDLALASAQALATSLLPAYRRVRARRLADLLNQLWREQPLAPAQVDGSRWTPEEVASVFTPGPSDDIFPDAFVLPAPLGATAPVLDPNLDNWGLAPVDALAAAVLDIARRAMWLTPIDEPVRRQEVRDLRKGIHHCRQQMLALHTANDDFWRRRLHSLPPRPPGAAERRAALQDWASSTPQPWVTQNQGSLSGQAVALNLVALLHEHHDTIVMAASVPDTVPPVVPGADAEATVLAKLTKGLLAQVDPLERFLAVEVCRQALGQAIDDPGLELALMQVSAYTPNSLGIPPKPSKLAGVQLSHFGAFYKQSWRANDWIWGRLDGAYRMTQAVLDPARLTQLGYDQATLCDQLRAVATGSSIPGDALWLQEQWQQDLNTITAELALLDSDDPPASLSATTTAVARRVQLEILRQELPRLVHAADADAEAGSLKGDKTDKFRSDYRLALQDRPAGAVGVDAAKIVGLWQGAMIGEESLASEFGSDLLATTATSVAAATANVLASSKSGLKPLNAVTRGVRGLTLVLYFMLRSSVGGGFGAGLASFVLAMGGALLAVSLTVTVPPVLTLIGATVVMAGLVMAALRSGSKVFALVFALLLIVGAGTLFISHLEGWVRTVNSTWWTLAAVAAFAALAIALGSIHTKATTPAMTPVPNEPLAG